MPDVLLCTGSGEWSALYVDGKLDVLGDHYHATDRILELFNITEESTDDFMMGGTSRDTAAAQTVNELRDYQAGMAYRAEQAESLRRYAADLIAQADALLSGKT